MTPSQEGFFIYINTALINVMLDRLVFLIELRSA
jgi:hypothetical protein